MNSVNLRKWLYIGGLILVVFCLYLLIQSYRAFQTTGILKINSTDKTAALSVSAAGHEARAVGSGHATIRLLPGEYLVGSSDAGRQSFTKVTIARKVSKTVELNPDSSPKLPTVEAVHFSGEDSLINSGLSSDQVSKIKQYLFRYKPTAKDIAINPASIVPAPHNPDVDTTFSLSFSVAIDAVNAKAVASYAGLNDIRLQLYAPDGSLLFDSASPLAQGD